MMSVQCVGICALVALTSCVGARSLFNETKDDSVGWWWAPKGILHHHKHHQHHSFDPKPWCQCDGPSCSCCIEDRIKHPKCHHREDHLMACVSVDWLSTEKVFSVVFSVNGRDVFMTDTTLSSSEMEECVPISSLSPRGKICFKLYKIEARSRKMCASLIGKVVVKGKEQSIVKHYGCFRVGALTEEEGADSNSTDDETDEASTEEGADSNTTYDETDVAVLNE